MIICSVNLDTPHNKLKKKHNNALYRYAYPKTPFFLKRYGVSGDASPKLNIIGVAHSLAFNLWEMNTSRDAPPKTRGTF